MWYLIDGNGKSKVVGLNSIDFKNAVLVAYQKQNKNQDSLIVAPPLQIKQNEKNVVKVVK